MFPSQPRASNRGEQVIWGCLLSVVNPSTCDPLVDFEYNADLVAEECSKVLNGVRPMVYITAKQDIILQFSTDDECRESVEKLEGLTEWRQKSATVMCAPLKDAHRLAIHRANLRNVEIGAEGREETPPSPSSLVARSSATPSAGATGQASASLTTAERDTIIDQLRQELAVVGRWDRSSSRLEDKVPKLSKFSGVTPPGKAEVSYEQWRYEMICLQENHTDAVIMEGIRQSVTGKAADMVRFLGVGASVDDVIAKFDFFYGRAASCDTLMQEFYQLQQEEAEAVPQYAIRLESALSNIQRLYPQRVTRQDRDYHLRERLFHGLRRTLRDSIRYEYKSVGKTYTGLLMAAREAEEEIDETNAQSVQIAATSKPNKNKFQPGGRSKQNINSLVAQIKDVLQLGDSSNGVSAHSDSGVQVAANMQTNPSSTEQAEPPPGLRGPQCFRCKGWGHVAKDCASKYIPMGNASGNRLEDGSSLPKKKQ